MTTLIGKVQETTKRLQLLTVWRPSERDPFCELDHWRTDAHTTIEQIYIKKRQQIEQFMHKHEREFMRQIARQRTLLNSIRKRLPPQQEMNSYLRTQNETSILTDLQKIDNDINTKLGRGEIIIETIPLNIEDSVTIGLKTYLSATSSMYIKEMSTRNQSIKPKHRSKDEVKHAYDNWLEKKTEETIITRRELQSAREYKQNAEENRLRRLKSKDAFDNWIKTKKSQGALVKKRLSISDNDNITQETNET